MPLIGERLRRGSAVAERVLDWPGDTTSSGDSVPLRLAGSLHALKLDGLALHNVYPPAEADDDTLWEAVEASFSVHETRLMQWLDSPPQTNEVRRAAVLLPALTAVANLYDAPVELLELGTSAGLNLRCDRFWLDLPNGGLGQRGSSVRIAPEWRGNVPSGPLPEIARRRGVDLNPLDPTRAEDRLRLLAYLWPDQPDRIARTNAAFLVARDIPAKIDACDAGYWVAKRLARPAEDVIRVIFHTIAWQYCPEASKTRALTAMAASPSPVLQIGMEADSGEGAGITLTTWPEGKTRHLGRACFHGRWVEWA